VGTGGRSAKIEETIGARPMKKTEKIKIIDELIEIITSLAYAKNRPHIPVVDDALSFVRNTLEKENAAIWKKCIDEVRWMPIAFNRNIPEQKFVEYWNSGKNEFRDILLSIKKEIELYTADDENEQVSFERRSDGKTPIIFLSHCSADKPYGDALAKFIIGLGVNNDQLIYTSHQLHKIPLDANIYDYLRKNIYSEIFMIFLLSDQYLDSPACLNEMGAAWVTQSDYTNIFTPNFNFENQKFHECVVDTRKMGAVLNGDGHSKANMFELKSKITTMFELDVDEKQALFILDEFIQEIIEVNKK
jgi:hypothetical protein